MQDMRIVSGPHLRFLSCLYGSERISLAHPQNPLFLSCLYGSERIARLNAAIMKFLSCLYGSEPKRLPALLA